MPLPEAKVAFFKKAGLSDAIIQKAGEQHETFVKSLKDLGLEWKGDDGGSLSVPGTDITLSEKDVPALAPMIATMSGMEAAMTQMAVITKQSVETSTKALELATKASQSLEAAVKDAMLPRSEAALKGHRASEAGDGITLTPEQLAAAAKEAGVEIKHPAGSAEARLKDDANWLFKHNQNYLSHLGLGGLGEANLGDDQISAAAAVAAATQPITGGQ